MTNPPHQPPSTQPPGDGVWVTPGQSFGQAYGQPGRWGPGQSVAQPDEQMVSWRPGESLPASYGPYRDGSFRSVRGLGRAASILIGVVVLVEVLFVASEWNTYRVVKDYVEGPVKDPERLDRADVISYAIAGAFVVVAVIATVLFIAWLWRARHNAELFCAARHRRSRTDLASDVPEVADVMVGASLSTANAVLTVASAVLVIRVVQLVDRLQSSRPQTPWWTTDPWAVPAPQQTPPVTPWPA